MDPIENILKRVGPSRSSTIAKILENELGMSPQAARQRISRNRSVEINRNAGLFPQREMFLYLKQDWGSEQYWTRLIADLRTTGSTYGCAIDGISARGGIVPVGEFDIVSGAPIRLKKQVSSNQVAAKLMRLHAMRVEEIDGVGSCYVANALVTDDLCDLDPREFAVLRVAENLALEGLREWVGRNSVGAFTKIAIRGENFPAQVGQFKFDLTAPCYLLPVRNQLRRDGISHTSPGFVVADSFVTRALSATHIRYFIRKVKIYEKTSNSGRLFPILLANEFSPRALKEGRSEGLMLVTPNNLFGRHVVSALDNLIETLKDVSRVLEDEDGLCVLIDALSEIEGRNGNMRGILFELLVAHLVQHALGAKDLAFRVPHTHSKNGRSTDLDILFKKNGNSVHIIECKGKHPGGSISIDEVEEWIEKIPIMRDYLNSRSDLKNLKRVYEFWTSGRFTDEALVRLKREKVSRTQQPIDFKDGGEVCELASNSNLNAIVRTLNEHFLNHPLARFTFNGTDSWKKRTGLLSPTQKQLSMIAGLQFATQELCKRTCSVVNIPRLPEKANRAEASDHIETLLKLYDNVESEWKCDMQRRTQEQVNDCPTTLLRPTPDSKSEVPF